MDGYEVPEKINKFHLNNDIQHFQYDRPFHKGPRDKDNEFKVHFLSNKLVNENRTILPPYLIVKIYYFSFFELFRHYGWKDLHSKQVHPCLEFCDGLKLCL